MTLDDAIVSILKKYPEGITAKEIAAILSVQKSEVNSILYRLEGKRVERLPKSFMWVLLLADKENRSLSNSQNVQRKEHKKTQVTGREILDLLNKYPEGLSVEEISDRLNVGSSIISSIFSSRLANVCTYDQNKHIWFVAKNREKRDKTIVQGVSSRPLKKQTFNQTQAMLSTFFNGNGSLIGLFEEVCKQTTAVGSFQLRANSTNIIGLSKPGRRFNLYCKKVGNTFSICFCNDNGKYPFKISNASTILVMAGSALKQDCSVRKDIGLSESVYSLEYLGVQRYIPESNPNLKPKSTRLDYNSKLYLVVEIPSSLKLVKVSAYILCKHQEDRYVAFSAYKDPEGPYYAITKDTFRDLKLVGVICTQLYKSKSNLKDVENAKAIHREESLLAACGYTTAQKDHLSRRIRRKTLDLIIENGVMTPAAILNYINYFVETHQGSEYRHNLMKWDNDKEYILETYLK